jgi:hypothetical protein
MNRETAALDALTSLLYHPQFGDPVWRQAIGDQLDICRSVHVTALALVPPPEFAAFHAEWLTSLGILMQAADLLEAGSDNQDPEAITQAADLMTEAGDHMALAIALLPSPTPLTSTPMPSPSATPLPTAQPATQCHPSYEGACLDPNCSDYDCAGGSGNGPCYTGPVRVVGPDVYDLDRDNDGFGCE